ncbi:MAG: helix-turn-helix domain-containing protein [Gammaproteobacteria bacterium]|nr:helix-turn-helix domain-containing protein [Gammaproteobacteria bacterium]
MIDQQNTVLLGPGEELKSAREAQGMTLEDASNKLFLTRQRLVAIEADDYNEFDSFIYIKGYLRSYAKLVGIAEHNILKKFESLGLGFSDNPTVITVAPKGQKLGKKKRQKKSHLVDLLAFIVLILLGSVWWLHRDLLPNNHMAVKPKAVQQMISPIVS